MFQQSKRLGAYIPKNTKMRKQASNYSEKRIYKLMSNACFGKTMGNLRRRGSLRFVTTEAQSETFIQRATFKNLKKYYQQSCACFPSDFLSSLGQTYSRGCHLCGSLKVLRVQVSLRRDASSL